MSRVRRFPDPSLFLGWAGALLLHAAWLLLPLPEIQPRDGAPIASMHLLSESRVWLWTPTLFSLPTRYGFSGALDAQGGLIEPPLESPLDLALFPDSARPSAPRSLPELPPPADAPPFEPLTPFPQPSAGRADAGVLRWNLFFPDVSPAPRSNFRPPTLPSLSHAVHLQGVMAFDEFGMVSNLLLESNGLADAERREVLRALRAYRIPRGLPPARHPFRISYSAEGGGE